MTTTNPIGLLLVGGALSLCACKSEQDKPEAALINSAVPYLSHNNPKELAGLVADDQPVAMKGIATNMAKPISTAWPPCSNRCRRTRNGNKASACSSRTSSTPTPKWPTNGKAP